MIHDCVGRPLKEIDMRRARRENKEMDAGSNSSATYTQQITLEPRKIEKSESSVLQVFAHHVALYRLGRY